MDYRKPALLLALMFLAVAFVPMVSEDSDASTESQFPSYISIDVVGIDIDLLAGDSIPVELESGSTADVIICLINTSADPMDYCQIEVVGGSKGDLSVTPSPSGHVFLSDAPVYFTLTVKADQYADNGVYTGVVKVHGYNPYDSAHFVQEIGISAQVTSPVHSEGMYNKFFGIYTNNLPAGLDHPLVTAAVTMLIWALLALLVGYVILPPVSRLIERRFPDSHFIDVQKSLIRMIFAIMIFTGFGECLQIVGVEPQWIYLFNSVSGAVYVVFGAVMAWSIWKAIINVLTHIFDEVDVEGVDSSLTPLFKMIGRIVITVVAVAIILASFGVDLAGILVSAGVISLGITLGAQNILGQFFSGIVLLSTRPFQKGDFVKINNEVFIVHKVKVMFTEFKNWDNDQIITMPNNTVTNATIINLTRDSLDTRIFVYMSVAYEADVEKAKELMVQAAMMHPHVIKDGSRSMPGTRLTNFLDSGIEYRLACYVDDFDNNSHYAGQIREIIFDLFKENGIEIPYTKMEVSLKYPCDGKRRDYDKIDDDL